MHLLTQMRDIAAQALVGRPMIEILRMSKYVHEIVLKRTSVKHKHDL